MGDTAGDPEVLEALGMGPGGRRRRPWRWAFGLGAVAVVAALGWWATRGPAADQRWEFAAVDRGTLEVTVSATGTLQALHEVEISSELSGIVAEVRVDHDEIVHEGDVLAVLDTRMLDAQAEQADAQVATGRASLAQARVQEEQARLDRARVEGLLAQGAIGKAEADRARLTHESAVAGVQLAQAQLANALATQRVAYTNLEKAVLRSPTDGVVLERNVDPGQAVVSAMTAPVLFRVAEDLHRMSLVVDVDEADVSRVKVGQPAAFSVAAWPDQEFAATVHTLRLAPRASTDVVVYEAELDVDNSEEQLRPGMTATAELVAERYPDAVLVPSAALRFDPEGLTVPEGPHVWVDESGELRSVRVEPGPSDGARTAVTSDEDLVGRRVAVARKSAGKE